jgi:hypothetical protein
MSFPPGMELIKSALDKEVQWFVLNNMTDPAPTVLDWTNVVGTQFLSSNVAYKAPLESIHRRAFSLDLPRTAAAFDV